ncbi:MAG TPA: hypothetical protein PLD77_01140 [Candidatus Dojkabacteria bacterium]|jgi:hypothetical protein|nr:hypothetical protein [Candidatus Dojkabacteria bacterium]
MAIQSFKTKKILSKLSEPLLIVVLILVFVIPVISVLNLTPTTGTIKKSDVLGTSTQSGCTIDLIGGQHKIFSSEKLTQAEGINTFEYTLTIGKRAAGTYSKPILRIKNKTDQPKTITFDGQTTTNTKSDIFLLSGNKSYILQNNLGVTHTEKIVFNPGEEKIIFLSVVNSSGVQFSENFKMTIQIEQ